MPINENMRNKEAYVAARSGKAVKPKPKPKPKAKAAPKKYKAAAPKRKRKSRTSSGKSEADESDEEVPEKKKTKTAPKTAEQQTLLSAWSLEDNDELPAFNSRSASSRLLRQRSVSSPCSKLCSATSRWPTPGRTTRRRLS